MTGRILEAYEIETNHYYQESINDCLTPQQASTFLDDCHNGLNDKYRGLFNRFPEYAPDWLNGLINCIPSVTIPTLGGSKHYFESDLTAFFYQSYAPSVLSSYER